MIHLEYVERSHVGADGAGGVHALRLARPAPTSARPTPSSGRGDGRVMTARKPRCIACSNCVLACPFGVPKMMTEFDLMMKCDMCYDRTSTGRKPMCATVCPSGALFYGTREEVEATAEAVAAGQPVPVRRADGHHQGEHDGARGPAPAEHLDVTAAMHEPPAGGPISLNILTDDPAGWRSRHEPARRRPAPRATRTAGRWPTSRTGGRTSRPTSRTTTTSPAGSSPSSWC